MGDPAPRDLAVAVRAWAKADYLEEAKKHAPGKRFRDLGPSAWALVFDTETLTDLSQRLRVGGFELRKAGILKQRGLIVDLDALSDDEAETVRNYAQAQKRKLLTREEFVEQIFFPYAYRRRALVVGFNLPFDLTRLAVNHGPAKGDKAMRGGFSLVLSNDSRLPRIQIKRAGPRACFIRFTIPDGRTPEQRNRTAGGDIDQHRGYFLDVSTLAGALFSQRFSLKRLADHLKTDHRKLEVEAHGEEITFDYLEYLEYDVLVTWECFETVRGLFALNGFSTPIYRIYSEAGIGKALLSEVGLQPWRQLQPDVPDWLIATIMETYYGGRSEAVIRRTHVPGVYVDFNGEYPLSFVLQDLWPYMTSTGIDWTHENTEATQRFLDELTSDTLLDPGPWKQLQALVLIEPDGDRLPTRARYKATKTNRAAAFNVGVPVRVGGPAQWYTLADAAVSKLETGRSPKLLAVIRLQPKPEQQTGLRPIDLGGNPDYRLDPVRDDLIKRLVELRATVKRHRDEAHNAGDLEAERYFDTVQRSMKTTASSTAYGTPIEMNVIEHKRPVAVTVYRPDGTSYRTTSRRIEEPGKWFHPLIATLVASGGRLLLALLMARVRERGGQYAFCDTDSLFIIATPERQPVACPGGSSQTQEGEDAIHSLAWADVQEIVNAFAPLNPYDPALIPSILEIEPENFDPQTGKQRMIYALPYASKRYGLFTFDKNGRPGLVGKPEKRRRSEHGLGHLLLPTDQELGTAPALDEWWIHTICTELEIPNAEPTWFGDEAIGQLSVTSQHEENSFRDYNKEPRYEDRVRPWNFLNIAHPTRPERTRLGINCVVSPYERDPTKRRHNTWHDRGDKARSWTSITTNNLESNDDTVVVQSYRDYFNDHRLHTDGKLLEPDGQRCHPWTKGLLQPALITATHLVRVGKESNPLTDNAAVDDVSLAFEYTERVCAGCDAPVIGRKKWCSESCRKRKARRRA
jgi:hypothetical protein